MHFNFAVTTKELKNIIKDINDDEVIMIDIPYEGYMFSEFVDNKLEELKLLREKNNESNVL